MQNIGKRKRKKIVGLITAFAGGCIVTGVVTALIMNGLFGQVSVSKSKYDQMSEVYEKYGKLEQIYDAIDAYYYTDFNEEDLLTGAYKGFVSGLEDPYSGYMTEEEYESWNVSATGDYSGIGITFSQDTDGNFLIISVEKESPAEQAGIKPGDFIISVNGETYEDLDQVAVDIRGEEGSEVELVCMRNGKEFKRIMKRSHIVQHSVTHKMLDAETGYIQISSFIESTGTDFIEALHAVEENGARNLILDLRNNGGGLVNTCVEVADAFLDAGVVTYVENKSGERTDYSAEDGKTDLHTVALVNENSASAAEILAAALQDNGTKLVGQKTFGKGVIQSTAEMGDGTALKLTIFQYFSPDGRAIHEKGIKPDYTVKNPEDFETLKGDPQLKKAMELL